MWGSLYVGIGKALMKVITVISPGLKLPFQQENWGSRCLTFGDLFDRSPDGMAAVKSSQIHRHLTVTDNTIQPITPPKSSIRYRGDTVLADSHCNIDKEVGSGIV